MGIVELILIGLSLAMDALAVSVGKGLAVLRPTWRQAACVGLWFGGFQALMPLAGWALGTAFASYIQAVDHWVAFGLLALIGGNMIREAVQDSKAAKAAAAEPGEAGESAEASSDSSAVSFAPKTMVFLAIATSIDAFATGIDFALLNVDIWLAIALIGAITFILSAVGLLFGGLLGERFRSRAQIAGGAVLILIGVKILIEHLFFG